MLLFFQLVYVALGLAVAIYSATSKTRMTHAFTLAFAVNVFPLAIMPYMSMDSARFLGIPLAYIPIAAAGAVFIFRNPKINKSNITLCLLCCVFVMYITFNGFYQHFLFGTIVYYFSWIFNFLLLFTVFSYFSKVEAAIADGVLRVFFKVLMAACFIGWFRYITGISPDANFMPMVNRNGTVVFLIMAAPLLFYVRQKKEITFTKFIFFWAVIALTLVLMQSRSGVLGFIFITVVYFARANFKSILASLFAISLFSSILMSPVGEKVFKRLETAQSSVLAVGSGAGIEQGQKDYARFMLIQSALTIFKNNIWFGAGIGVPNYRAEFEEHVSFFSRNSKAHNFYLSYLAELGIIGFPLLILILILIYRKLAPLSSDYRAFKVSYLGMALMMTMNEYILLPELWFFYGMLGGMSCAIRRAT